MMRLAHNWKERHLVRHMRIRKGTRKEKPGLSKSNGKIFSRR